MICLLCIGFIYHSTAHASAETRASLISNGQSDDPVNVQDVDGDSDPDVASISIKIRDDRDRLLVFDETDQMPWEGSLDRYLCYERCSWVIDLYGDFQADLIIKFRDGNGDALEALIFDDINSDGKLPFEYEGKTLLVSEASFPKLVFRVEQGWWLDNGDVNWNLSILVDGSDIDQRNTYRFSETWQPYLGYDGAPDTSLVFFDINLDGTPEYGMWRLLADAPDITLPIGKTFLWKNVGLKKPRLQSQYLFWPYLVIEPDDTLMYFDTTPYFTVDWDSRQIDRLSFDGYPIETGYHVNTFTAFQLHEANYANFENMQAYYDLAEDSDNYPELHARIGYFESDDPIVFPGVTVENIRYSWNLKNTSGLSWDYKLDLIGNHKLDGSEEFPDFSFVTIPYAQLPGWIMEKPWEIVNLISVQQRNYLSTEGIYETGAISTGSDQALWAYMGGWEDASPLLGPEEIQLTDGLRAEVAPQLRDRVALYYSPVDKLLHLFKSEYGVWRVNQSESVKYESLGPEGYVDHWIYLHEGNSTQELWCVSGQVIYYDHVESILKWKKASCQGMLFQPPDDHASWKNMQKLEANFGQETPTFLPRSMFTALPGEESGLTGVAAKDFRHVASGYRLILYINYVSSQFGSEQIDVPMPQPGVYVLQWIDGEFNITPFRPAEIELALHVIHEPYGMYLEAANHGDEDLRGLSLQITSSCGGEERELSWQKLNLLAGEEYHLSLRLLPPIDNSCTLYAQVLKPDGGVLTEKTHHLESVKNYWLQQRDIVAISSESGRYWSAGALLVLVSVFTGALWMFHMVRARWS